MALEVIHSRLAVPAEMDLLIVLGKNLGVDSTPQDIRQSRDYLSVDSRINTLAAGELCRPGLTILMSGGHTTGKGYPSQPTAAKAYLLRRYPHIAEDDVIIDEMGFDTKASAESIAKMELDDYEHIGLESIGYHVKNAAIIFKKEGARLDSVIASEDILAERSKHHKEYIVAWRGLSRVKKEVRRERARAVAIHTIDRKSTLTRRYTARRLQMDN